MWAVWLLHMEGSDEVYHNHCNQVWRCRTAHHHYYQYCHLHFQAGCLHIHRWFEICLLSLTLTTSNNLQYCKTNLSTSQRHKSLIDNWRAQRLEILSGRTWESWEQLVDFAIEVDRFQFLKMILSESRKWYWQSNLNTKTRPDLDSAVPATHRPQCQCSYPLQTIRLTKICQF